MSWVEKSWPYKSSPTLHSHQCTVQSTAQSQKDSQLLKESICTEISDKRQHGVWLQTPFHTLPVSWLRLRLASGACEGLCSGPDHAESLLNVQFTGEVRPESLDEDVCCTTSCRLALCMYSQYISEDCCFSLVMHKYIIISNEQTRVAGWNVGYLVSSSLFFW